MGKTSASHGNVGESCSPLWPVQQSENCQSKSTQTSAANASNATLEAVAAHCMGVCVLLARWRERARVCVYKGCIPTEAAALAGVRVCVCVCDSRVVQLRKSAKLLSLLGREMRASSDGPVA